MKRNIPFSPPDITEEEIAEVVDTLRSGWITTGPKTKLLEKKVAEFCNADKAVCLNSATASMELTLRALGVGPGDEVITTAYTYTASASVIEHVGATIVLSDTGKNSYEIDYEKLPELITEKTKAIIPVDIAGVMCDYEKIYEVLESKQKIFNPENEIQKIFGRVIVVADAAHSFGASSPLGRSGEVADFSCFSFHAVKNFTTAEGGAVTWKSREGLDSEELYNQYMLLSLHGQSKDALAKSQLGSWEYDIVIPGYKSNMTDIMASIGLAQLKRYDYMLTRRKEIIEMYNEGFKDLDVEFLNHYSEEKSSSGHLYFIRLLNKDSQYRDAAITKMAERGIATNVHYKPLPMHTAYKKIGFDILDYPNAYRMYENVMTLPLNTLMSNDDVNYVITNFEEILK